ncbi:MULTISPECIES: hypothetical protein [Streptomyces]|nr:hypothetical protein [Streptomyces sp. SCSIO ZS0520]
MKATDHGDHHDPSDHHGHDGVREGHGVRPQGRPRPDDDDT